MATKREMSEKYAKMILESYNYRTGDSILKELSSLRYENGGLLSLKDKIEIIQDVEHLIREGDNQAQIEIVNYILSKAKGKG